VTWFLYTVFPVTILQPPEHSGLVMTLAGYQVAGPRDPRQHDVPVPHGPDTGDYVPVRRIEEMEPLLLTSAQRTGRKKMAGWPLLRMLPLFP
jgi:hypothetical protein